MQFSHEIYIYIYISKIGVWNKTSFLIGLFVVVCDLSANSSNPLPIMIWWAWSQRFTVILLHMCVQTFVHLWLGDFPASFSSKGIILSEKPSTQGQYWSIRIFLLSLPEFIEHSYESYHRSFDPIEDAIAVVVRRWWSGRLGVAARTLQPTISGFLAR